MDEPTTGLHMSDVGHLLDMMNRLVDNGDGDRDRAQSGCDPSGGLDHDLGPEGGEGAGSCSKERLLN